MIIRDWDRYELKKTVGKSHVIYYMGISRTGLITDSNPSASIKAKNFGSKSLSEVASITGIPLSTLNDWFKTKKIAFHCALEFAESTIKNLDK